MSTAPLLLADRTQKMHRNVRILRRQDKNNKKRRTKQFGALRLFSSQTTATYKKKTDIDRHGQKLYSNSSLLPDLPLFSLHTNFKQLSRHILMKVIKAKTEMKTKEISKKNHRTGEK